MHEDAKLSTWGVKVSDDVREKLKNALDNSGLQGKDFMESLVSLYEAHILKDSQPIVAQEMGELEALTRRIMSMYVGLGERVKTLVDDKERQHQSAQEQDKETIRLLHGKIQELEEEKKDARETCVKLQQEADDLQKHKVNLEHDYITKVNGLTELQNSNRALIEEYKEKNDNLTGLIGEYKHYKDTMQAMKAEAEVREKEVGELQSKLDSTQHEIDALNAAMLAAEEKHRADRESLQDRLALDSEKHILKLEKEYQEHIQQVRDEYNQHVRDLLTQMQQAQEKMQQPQEKKTKNT